MFFEMAYSGGDSIFCVAKRYFAEIKMVVTPVAFNELFSLRDTNEHVVS